LNQLFKIYQANPEELTAYQKGLIADRIKEADKKESGQKHY